MDWLNFLFGVIGTIGVLLSVVFYFRSVKRKRIAYLVHSDLLIFKGAAPANVADRLEVKIDGTPIDELYRTVIFVWNDGNEVIRQSDIAESRPLIVTWQNDPRVVEVQVAKLSKPESNVRALLSPTGIICEFAFLNEGDGYRLDLLHSISATFELSGTLIGRLSTLRRFRPNAGAQALLLDVDSGETSENYQRMRRSDFTTALTFTVYPIMMGIGSVVILILSLLTPTSFSPFSALGLPRWVDHLFWFLLAAMCALMPVTYIWDVSSRRDIPRSLR